MQNLADVISVVTGGAGGIGEALARHLAARGSRVAIADISQDRAEAAAQALGHGAKGYRCDVADLADTQALAAAIERDMGAANLVFANAGIAVGGKLTDTVPDEFQWMFDVNVRGTFNTILAFARQVGQAAEAGNAARFVLTGSENSVGLPSTGEMTAYTATKHAILALADGLRRDMAGAGVKVSIFCPGLVNTGIWNARVHRQARYGGAEELPADIAERMRSVVADHGQDPDLTARLVLEGIDRDEFMIITDPKIRDFAARRHAEVETALDTLDRRMNAIAGQQTGASGK